jgi:hypothetical protein
MSVNRITIAAYIGEDEIEYSCQYLKHYEGINRLYHSTCHIEYNSKDSNMDIVSLKNKLAEIEADQPVKIRIEMNYLDLNKTLYIQGSAYASKVSSTAGSTTTTYILYLSHETRPLTLSSFSGVSYQAQAKDMIEHRLINQCERLNLSNYTEFLEKVNYNTEARFPTHPMVVQWKQSTYAFMDRVLGTHGLWYQLYSHKSGVDFVIGDNNQVFSGHSDEIKDDKEFNFDNSLIISLQNKQEAEAAYQYQRLYNGSPITDIAISPKLFDETQASPKHYIDYQALKRRLSDKRSQQQNHQQSGVKLQREAQQSHKSHSELTAQQRKQTVSSSHQNHISRRQADDAKKQFAQAQQAFDAHQAGNESLENEISQLSKQLAIYESFYTSQKQATDRNFLQSASFRQFENISFYHTNQETPSQEMTDLLPLAFTDKDKAMKPYIIQDYSIQGDDYFPVVNRDQFEIMAQTQQEQIIWNNAPRFVASFQGYLLRAGTKVDVTLNQADDFPEADKKHFQDYSEYLITDVLYEFTAEKNQQGQATTDSLGRVIHYQEKHTVMGSFPKCDYRPLVNFKKLIGHADYLTGVKPYQVSPASFEIVPNKNGYIPICLPLDYQENVGSSCYYAPRVSSSNTGKMNQSHPIYPDTELSISFLNGNPEMPVIRGAVANKATGHVNNQSQDKRMMLTSPQGHTFSNTLNAGDDNSSTLKTKHGYQSQKDGSHQTYFSLSNIGSTAEEGKKQLDITEATTANKSLKTGNKFEQYAGVTSNDTTQPNYGLVIDPNIEEPKVLGVPSKVSEVKDTAISANAVKPQEQKATLISYTDFLNRPPTGLKFDVLDAQGQRLWCSQFDDQSDTVGNTVLTQQPVSVMVHTQKDQIEQRILSDVEKLKSSLDAIINKSKAKASAMQKVQDNLPWYQKKENQVSVTSEGLATGIAHFFSAVWEMSKKGAITAISFELQPAETFKKSMVQSKEQLEKGYDILNWLRHNPDVWPVLWDFAKEYSIIFKDYPIYALQKGAEALGGILPMIILAVITKNFGFFVEEVAGDVGVSSDLMFGIAQDTADLSRYAITKSESASGRIEVSSKRPKSSGSLPKIEPVPVPMNLSEVGNSLKIARENLTKTNLLGYQHPFTDEALAELSKKPFSSRFMASIQTGEKAGSDTIPYIRDSGRASMWATSLDMLLEADTDPKLISDILGLTYDKTKTYYLYVIDTKKLADANLMPDIFAPTFDNMKKLGKKEFIPEGATSESIDYIMTPEYQKEYAQHINNFSAMEYNRYDPDDIKRYAQEYSRNKQDYKNIINRHGYLTEIGANEYFEGNGLTKYINNPGNEYGVVEYMAFSRKENTPTINQLKEINALEVFHAEPIERK